IPMAEVQTILEQRKSPVALTDRQKQEMKHAVLDMLIEDAIMRQYLHKTVPAPPPAEIQKEMAKVLDFLKKKNMSLQEFLREEGQSEQQLTAHIATRLQWKAFLVSQI